MTEATKSYWGVPVPQRGELRKFGVVMAVVLALIGGYLWYRDAVGPAQVVHGV